MRMGVPSSSGLVKGKSGEAGRQLPREWSRLHQSKIVAVLYKARRTLSTVDPKQVSALLSLS